MKKSEIPQFVMKCYRAAKEANRKNREREIECLKFYAGGDLQWREEEIADRRAKGKAWVTVNKMKPAVDQIEGDIRLNPPGPQVFPVGDGGDADTADIHEGLIREVEYRCDAKTAYSTAGKYVGASGFGVLELSTEYENDRSFAQRLCIHSIEDPSTVFFDPNARMANRQDAAWAGKLRMYSKEDYTAQFGAKRKVLNQSSASAAMGWISEAIGAGNALGLAVEWTGAGKGPYFVCEFYQVEVEPTKLRACSDHICRFDDEELPKGVHYLDGEENVRSVGRRKICKYVVDAFEVLDETEWLGRIIPLIPVLGPEVFIDGKLHRLSLISGALDSQRALNYVATTATELAGLMPKSPWIGWRGQFDDPKWQSANNEMWAYLEIEPVYGTDENGTQSLLPAPQRNMWEAPIQWLLALASYFSDSIKATTAIYDPSLGAQKGDQSGKAIEQLRSESNVGNYSYADNLHRAISVMYREMVYIFPQIMDGPRVVTIVKPDSQHEIVKINELFGDGSSKPTKNLANGQYSARAMAGPSFETRQMEAIDQLTHFFKAAPQILASPIVFSKIIRMVGRGNPSIEAIADAIEPNASGEMSPAQMQSQLQQLGQQKQQLTQLVQVLQQKLVAKLPEQDTKRYIAELTALAGIREAEIKAGIDKAEIDASMLEHLTGLAHENALAAQQQEHQQGMQQNDQAASMLSQQSDQAHQAAQTAQQQQADQQAAQQQQQSNPQGS